MNILELTGMKSTKYGGVESYFAELVKICRVDKFIFVYESMPISENYVNDINKCHIRTNQITFIGRNFKEWQS